MVVSFSKPTDGSEAGVDAPIRNSMNYFAQPNAISRTVSNFATSLRRVFESVAPVPEVSTRVWARQAFTA